VIGCVRCAFSAFWDFAGWMDQTLPMDLRYAERAASSTRTSGDAQPLRLPSLSIIVLALSYGHGGSAAAIFAAIACSSPPYAALCCRRCLTARAGPLLSSAFLLHAGLSPYSVNWRGALRTTQRQRGDSVADADHLNQRSGSLKFLALLAQVWCFPPPRRLAAVTIGAWLSFRLMTALSSTGYGLALLWRVSPASIEQCFPLNGR